MAFDLDPNYKQVPERMLELKAAHPDARLRPTDPDRPYWIESIPMVDGETGETFSKVYIVYSAACYRDADDKLPAIGVAWEPFPGKTPYTKDSELQNAETSAWGRAIVACLRSESKAIASAEDVRNRQADQAEQPTTTRRAEHGVIVRPPVRSGPDTGTLATEKQLGMIAKCFKDKGFVDDRTIRHAYIESVVKRSFESSKELTKREASTVIEALLAEGNEPAPPKPCTVTRECMLSDGHDGDCDVAF